MLFMAEMTVNIPLDIPAEADNEIKVREKAYSKELQRSG
jgi:muconolactone D-isomerase